MIFYLLTAPYLAAGIAFSILVVDGVREAANAESLRDLDAQDWSVSALLSFLWPLTLAVVAWRFGYLIYRQRLERARTAALLRSLGATTDEEDSTRV